MGVNARRIALMTGCVQKALAPQINAAGRRVLTRRGYQLVPLRGAGCCGSLLHHLGKNEQAKAWAKRAIEAFEREGPFDGVLITATGCAAHLKDLQHLFAGDPVWKPRAAAFAAKTRDFLDLATPLPAIANPNALRVAWQAPCSLQNGLGRAAAGKTLLQSAGFEVVDIPEGHLCCGSAGSYSILQPEIAERLRERKLANLASIAPQVVATANIGCLHHLSGSGAPPVVHIAELIDWTEGGAPPAFVAGRELSR
jgi:glycolate oxidase iron-sulfur subunit